MSGHVLVINMIAMQQHDQDMRTIESIVAPGDCLAAQALADRMERDHRAAFIALLSVGYGYTCAARIVATGQTDAAMRPHAGAAR